MLLCAAHVPQVCVDAVLDVHHDDDDCAGSCGMLTGAADALNPYGNGVLAA
jgi:hypothetical protein